MHNKYIFIKWFILFLPLFLGSCKRNFQYSVLEVRPYENDLNNKAIAAIKELPPKDTFSFLVISDTQIAYDELQDFVEHANGLSEDSIAFVLHGGDYTDYGANFEYNFYYDEIKKLKFPIVGTIGNHDMLGNGRYIYRKFLGSEEFTFEYGNTAFVVFNSNSREVAFDGSIPNLPWLEQTVNSLKQKKNIVYLSHISPQNSDYDQRMAERHKNIVLEQSNSRLSLHGHTHSYEYYETEGGFKYVVVPTILKRSYVKVDVADTTLTVHELFY